MSGVRRLEYVELNVENLSNSVEWYTDVMGLEEVERDDKCADLRCESADWSCLRVNEGTTGVNRFAIRVDDDGLDRFRQSVQGCDVNPTPVEPSGLAIKDGSCIDLPSGITVDVVTVPDRSYCKPTTSQDIPAPTDIAPVELDHITLMTDDLEGDIAFLQDHLNYHVSDYHLADDEENYRMAWGRFGEYHHDVAFVATDDPEQTLHHLAWTMPSIDHLARFADALARSSHRLETGISRHFVGSNVFAYFQEPGGNRFEISTEMATVDVDSDAIVNRPSVNTFTAWGGITPPDSFANGS